MATLAPITLTDLPIPHDAAPGPGWCPFMREMADHIGAYHTLVIVEALGGRKVYVPADAARSPFLPLVGMEKARLLSWVYRRETLELPTGGYALARARRGCILASVREGALTVSQAARILGVRRDYASRLVSRTDEGKGVVPTSINARPRDPRQGDLFSQN